MRERKSGDALVQASHGELGAWWCSDEVTATEMAYVLYLGSKGVASGSMR
jgi:hypothetical protein